MTTKLRHGAEAALVALGTGFLAHPENRALRGAMKEGALGRDAYFTELLRLLFGAVFLMIVEDRDGSRDSGQKASGSARESGTKRLRELAMSSEGGAGEDLWDGLRAVFDAGFRGDEARGWPRLGFGLLDLGTLPGLRDAKLANTYILCAFGALARASENGSYERIGGEDLGAIYQSLLELLPGVEVEESRFVLGEDANHKRRTTGSYYTPEALIDHVLDRALEPVLGEVARGRSQGDAVAALMAVRICDPSCGVGHFLVAAARRLTDTILRISGEGDEGAHSRVLTNVVEQCLFGVDVNPLTAELCRVSLWLEAKTTGRALSSLDAHIQCGNSLLGATPRLLALGVPNDAFRPSAGGDRSLARALLTRNRKEMRESRAAADLDLPSDAGHEHASTLEANTWASAFVWGGGAEALRALWPTEATRREASRQGTVAPGARLSEILRLSAEHQLVHWHLRFPEVFSTGTEEALGQDGAAGWTGGFDVVVGNPPWISHAGRASQLLAPGVKSLLQHTSSAFAGYPTTHGVFVHLAARLLRQGGRLGLVVPSSVSELDGYEATRAAHDALCDFPDPLVDFGEGRFPGVTQPCMALVSERAVGGRAGARAGTPWPMTRPDLDACGAALLARLGTHRGLPPELFGERGFQSDRSLAEHFIESREAQGRFTRALREGGDIQEFQLLPARHFADGAALGAKLREPSDYARVKIVIRQTARFPIAAASDGAAFRNSLLAAFSTEAWPADVLLTLLNSALVRWAHYFRFRDARQPVLPQLKIGHLRAIPAPSDGDATVIAALGELGQKLTRRNSGATTGEREALDEAVFSLYRLMPEERRLVSEWHAAIEAAKSGKPNP